MLYIDGNFPFMIFSQYDSRVINYDFKVLYKIATEMGIYFLGAFLSGLCKRQQS